jgi:hypothetical protein
MIIERKKRIRRKRRSHKQGYNGKEFTIISFKRFITFEDI